MPAGAEAASAVQPLADFATGVPAQLCGLSGLDCALCAASMVPRASSSEGGTAAARPACANKWSTAGMSASRTPRSANAVATMPSAIEKEEYCRKS